MTATTTATEGVAFSEQRDQSGFSSILYERAGVAGPEETGEPACLVDLNLDQLVSSVQQGREEYGLSSVFFAPLSDLQTIRYRQAVFRDLEREEILEAIRLFCEQMGVSRTLIRRAGEARHRYVQARLFLEASLAYCEAVRTLSRDLTSCGGTSEGLRGLGSYLAHYVSSAGFLARAERARGLKDALDALRYGVAIRGLAVFVSAEVSETDLSAEVLATFDRFSQDRPARDRVTRSEPRELSQVEERVLELLGELFPELFASLVDFGTEHSGFGDATIERFAAEVQFYLAYLEYIAPLREGGVSFCYPELVTATREVRVEEAVDLVLCASARERGDRVVANDITLAGEERVLVVTGPNQGGKTTLARAFGQLHYLGALGCPVAARRARLVAFDQIFTHFAVEEDLRDHVGKLEDDLIRMRDILCDASAMSVVIVNEIFSSTTFDDALFLGQQVLEAVGQLGLVAVYVTFIEELASYSDATVSMVASVDPADPTVRTYKVVRQAADGLAYAISIAQKYGLDSDQLRRRLLR